MDAVFPARAGMDRQDRPNTASRTCVPRPRGDGPVEICGRYVSVGCSPPARGWTDDADENVEQDQVFPARAGMDRRLSTNGCGAMSVPRPRGDGPAAASAGVSTWTCSPPARGWTAVTAQGSWMLIVFPARAGMDRRE